MVERNASPWLASPILFMKKQVNDHQVTNTTASNEVYIKI